MTSKTLVFCCNSLWGLVNFRGRVIESLARDGHRVVLVARADIPVEQALALGAEFIEWGVTPRGVHPWGETKALYELVQIYRKLAPDLAFQFTIKPVMYGAIVSMLTGIRCVSVITGLGYLFLADNWKSRIGKALYRTTLHRSHEVWFLNDDDRGFFEVAGLIRGLSVRTLPGEGIDVDRFARAPLPQGDGPFVFLMIARLVKDKGVVEYAQAARIVRRERPDAAFRLLGPAYSANAASVSPESIQEWVNEGSIEYLGAADDVRPAITQSHCVVLPSYREGLPRVLMEAAAMARPVVTTDVTGCRDVVQDGVTGLLCKAQDAESLAQACLRMMDRDDLGAMANRAHALARDHYDDRHIIELYNSVVEAAGSKRG